jgi:hypothetical protein
MTVEVPQCMFCVHLKKGTYTCSAFPVEIPKDILLNNFMHTKPYPGDHGILFEAKQ